MLYNALSLTEIGSNVNPSAQRHAAEAENLDYDSRAIGI
jgi:hypothetical protein